jgi:hypothetical protein
MCIISFVIYRAFSGGAGRLGRIKVIKQPMSRHGALEKFLYPASKVSPWPKIGLQAMRPGRRKCAAERLRPIATVNSAPLHTTAVA